MLRITSNEDYYPTPESFLERIMDGWDWEDIDYILEPSAGKGNIAEYAEKAKEKWSYHGVMRTGRLDIDCIEIEPELRVILKDKKLRVVHDDFLTFHTYKHYDLILMNPPFSQGARHLLKAIEVQSITGGGIVCILNAETLRNAYTRERQELVEKLKQYGAEITYYENAFSVAENPTNVEVAVVKLIVPSPERETTIFDTLREKDYEEYAKKAETTELAESDIVKALVAQYNRELEWGLRLYDELLELQSQALDGKARIFMSACQSDFSHDREDFTVNAYVRTVRRKYWEKFFEHPVFYSKLTSNLANKYSHRVNRFVEYDFSVWNIKSIQEEIAKTLIKGVEDCIIELFEELSYQYSWDESLKHNIHYYNGWKSNSCWKINKKVVIPLSVWEYQKYYDPPRYELNFDHGAHSKLSDIEKVLNYLDNGGTEEIDLTDRLYIAKVDGQTRNIRLKYFDVTFYKKGTCHITFTNERLLKKLNIFGSQKKGWLPFGYGRKRYEQFAPEEQEVIESFEGRAEYNQTLMESQYYLFDAGRSVPMLTSGKE